MCIIMRWSRNRSASWAERFRTSSLLCTYKLCDYYTPIPILSPFLFTPSLYAPILNLQDFSFTCKLCTSHVVNVLVYIASHHLHTHAHYTLCIYILSRSRVDKCVGICQYMFRQCLCLRCKQSRPKDTHSPSALLHLVYIYPAPINMA